MSGEYSFQLSIRNERTDSVNSNTYTGILDSNVSTRGLALQNAILTLVENFIQKTMYPNFILGTTPLSGGPNSSLGIVYHPDDIIASVIDMNIYFIFSSDMQVKFIQNDVLLETFTYNWPVTTQHTFTQGTNSYNVEYSDFQTFNISSGLDLIYNGTNAIYKGKVLPEQITSEALRFVNLVLILQLMLRLCQAYYHQH